jgi:hypothetical protein
MIPRIRKKIHYEKKPYIRKEAKHDFMKNWTIVKKWILANYDITTPELELILFLYSEKLFTRTQFEEYSNFLTWDRMRLHKLIQKEYVYIWRKGVRHEQNLYEVSFKGKKMVSSMYKKLLGLEPIPESKRRNKVFLKKAPFAQKTLAIAIKNYNTKLRTPRPSLELQ